MILINQFHKLSFNAARAALLPDDEKAALERRFTAEWEKVAKERGVKG